MPVLGPAPRDFVLSDQVGPGGGGVYCFKSHVGESYAQQVGTR